MPDRSYHQMMAEVVAETISEVQDDLRSLIEETWPSLIELKKPAERLAWYRTIDWAALRDTSELFWAKLSADAQRLMGAEENRIANATAAYEQQAFTQEHAYRAETQPLGLNPISENPNALGMNAPLPLGRMGT